MARLRPTNADYVAIAVSPALVMALVGSLVFFLIEVLYVGDYEFRLNYVFALFVFATVLIARIAIEFGSERAAMFSMPLGLLTYLALMRFVEHQSSLSWLINFLLLGVVWWCAHKLTWDCTVIDDNEDSSGEGLLGKVGLDAGQPAEENATAAADNELLAGDELPARPWWRRLLLGTQGPHAPGLWVLYFSLAALPLFGLGQGWIPAGDVGRRRYAFGLLAVYVASALSLLVTTSFLGLRRYLRQRNVEMPAPMAATWVSLGAVLIVLVMFAAALLPRPSAEYAISKAPWHATSPGDNESSQVSLGDEGAADPQATARRISNQPNAPQGNQTAAEQETDETGESATEDSPNSGRQSGAGEGSEPGDSRSQQEAEDHSASPRAEPADSSGAQQQPPQDEAAASSNSPPERRSNDSTPGAQSQSQLGDAPQASESEEATATPPRSIREMLTHPRVTNALQPLQTVVGSLGNVLKLAFYAVLALAIAYFIWIKRSALAQALADILRELREFFARLLGRPPAIEDQPAGASGPRRRSFSDFSDPFVSGRARSLPPVELVRYTFEAFEAWAGDHGRPRSLDQTPQELVRSVLPPQTPMYDQARRLAQLYSEAAYSAATVSREAASGLQSLWQLMRSSSSSAHRLEGS